jgi:thioester reductase-like protein
MMSVDDMRHHLTRYAADYLQRDPGDIRPDVPLSEYGLDSVYALTVAADIEELLGVRVHPTLMWDYPSIDSLAAALAKLCAGPRAGAPSVHSRSIPADALVREAVLPDDITPQADARMPATPPYQRILLTGATGFAGAYLVRELLDRSAAQLFVLVRAANAEQAVDRVQDNMAAFGLWHHTDRSRLTGVPGDLGLSRLGLSRERYDDLADRLDMIVHNGAAVNFVLSYERLKQVNVLGTLEVLRLACQRRIKPVNLVSSLGVLPERPGRQTLAEAPVSDPTDVVGGYRQTKWVTDRMATTAGARGLPVTVYRPGNITGAQRTGACTTDTFLSALIRGSIELGTAMDFAVDLFMVPVDFCAAAIARISLDGSAHGAVFNLPGAAPVRWNTVVALLRDYGYPVRTVPYESWYEQLTSAGSEHALAPYLRLFGADAPAPDLGVAGNEPRIATDQLDKVLSDSGLTCHPVDRELMRSYLDYFVDTGYLPAPPAAQPGDPAASSARVAERPAS